ncbi:ABC transporter ATP-binding protein [uncultured Nocardioides sp.]|uniref:ABC transporter ATP-binding protein n=1 Tax=uncultured Nocardioides sp. TaxID=198441 RepID=UPI0026101825|nr:ABC transporter ATP-binding protein [uncultured Nocardioides sp.]
MHTTGHTPGRSAADTTGGAAIELVGLEKTFRTRDGDVLAVRGIDLTVDAGEVVAVLGPNGAGKTTTLDMVLGLTEPTGGTARVFGQRPREAVTAGRVAAVLQTGGLLRDLTVAETVRLVASTYAAPSPVDEVLERAGIAHLGARLVSKCSGGEQQRLRFALALLPDPDLLVLDEPTAGMDVTARREFWDAMHAEAAAGRTVVFATHYLSEADTFADRIVVIGAGRVLADGTTAEIRSRVAGRAVSVDAPADPAARERLVAVARSLPGVAAAEVTGGRLHVTGTDSDAVARALLVDHGAHGLEVVAGSLDDAFATLTRPETRPENRTTSDETEQTR